MRIFENMGLAARALRRAERERESATTRHKGLREVQIGVRIHERMYTVLAPGRDYVETEQKLPNERAHALRFLRVGWQRFEEDELPQLAQSAADTRKGSFIVVSRCEQVEILHCLVREGRIGR